MTIDILRIYSLIQRPETTSRYDELTGLEFLDFWMQSIYSYTAKSPKIKQNHVQDKPQLSPPIFIVGTHKNSIAIHVDPKERERLVSVEFLLDLSTINIFCLTPTLSVQP